MKKRIMMVMVVAVLVVSALALVACGGTATLSVKAVDAQITALTEVKSGTADAAIIDSTMAGYLINKKDSDYKDLAMITVDGTNFEKEYYGVAAKKGKSKLMSFINNGIKTAQANGKYDELLTKYGLASRKVAIDDEITVAEDWKSDLNDQSKVVIGYTINAPMGIVDGKNVTGFDIDLARAVFEGTGVTVVCKEINWDSKTADLNSGNIDLVWNGLTINEDRLNTMEISVKYLMNEQAIVVKSANKDTIKAVADFAGKKVVVENGSAGQDAAAVIESVVNAK